MAINKKAVLDIDHLKSPHAMALQRSKYLSIEDDISIKTIYQGNMANRFKEEKVEKGSES